MPRSFTVTLTDSTGRVIECWPVIFDPNAPEMPEKCNLALCKSQEQFVAAVVQEVRFAS